MWFMFAVITALCWGGSDLFSKKGTNPDDKYSHWRMVIMVGIVMGVHALFMLIKGTPYHLSSLITYLPVSAMYILSMTIGYAGLRYIELSVSSPICNSSGAVTSILCFLILKQEMSPLQIAGVAIICLGVFLMGLLETRQDKDLKKERAKRENRKYAYSFIAILFPILYCIIDGVGSFADAVVLETLDENEANISYELTFAFVALIAFIYIRFIRKQKFRIIDERVKGYGALCETAGQFFYVFAMADNAVVAAPLIATYSIFSVVLSRIFLKEKLSLKQYLTIAFVMVGIGILGFTDA